MGLIIPTTHLEKRLPADASDKLGAITDAVTMASALVNTFTSRRYETWDEYTEASDDEYTLNAPQEIVHITTQVATHLYWLNVGEVVREGEGVDREARIDYYKKMLEDPKFAIKPTKHTQTVSLDTNGYQLIGSRNQNILTHKAYVVSLDSDGDYQWNLGEHFLIIKGGLIDIDEYWNDGWYIDAATHKDTLEGTLHYWRSYRNDGGDYAMTYKTGWDNISG
jgi:hypothetical protein